MAIGVINRNRSKLHARKSESKFTSGAVINNQLNETRKKFNFKNKE